jgi:hypothetical protein
VIIAEGPLRTNIDTRLISFLKTASSRGLSTRQFPSSVGKLANRTKAAGACCFHVTIAGALFDRESDKSWLRAQLYLAFSDLAFRSPGRDAFLEFAGVAEALGWDA